GRASRHAARAGAPEAERPHGQYLRHADELRRAAAPGRHRRFPGAGAQVQMNERVPVLIVGGGPVGLALAGELGWRGVPCLLVGQGDGTIVTPKMNEVTVRTMEFCRRWGIADKVHNCPFPKDHARDAVFVTSFTGYELGRIPRPAVASSQPESWSPMRLQTCSQMWFDPILRDFALSSPCVTLRHRTRLESFQDNGVGVSAEIVDLATGKRERIEADYLVGCDGAMSAIRGQLGIGLT